MNIFAFALTPWFWLILTVIFALLELPTAGTLITIWFALSSLLLVFITGITKMLGAPLSLKLQLGIFIGLSLVFFVFTRPFALKKLKIGKEKTNIDSLIDEEALVTKKIARFENGEIKLKGKYWTAVSEDGTEFPEGEICTITGFEGVKARVRKSRDLSGLV